MDKNYNLINKINVIRKSEMCLTINRMAAPASRDKFHSREGWTGPEGEQMTKRRLQRRPNLPVCPVAGRDLHFQLGLMVRMNCKFNGIFPDCGLNKTLFFFLRGFE